MPGEGDGCIHHLCADFLFKFGQNLNGNLTTGIKHSQTDQLHFFLLPYRSNLSSKTNLYGACFFQGFFSYSTWMHRSAQCIEQNSNWHHCRCIYIERAIDRERFLSFSLKCFSPFWSGEIEVIHNSNNFYCKVLMQCFFSKLKIP